MASAVQKWPNFFEIDHEMANLATLVRGEE